MIGITGSFLIKGFTNTERWIVIFFCLAIILIGILFDSKIGHIFRETVYYVED